MKFGTLALAFALATAPALVACSSDDEPDNAAEATDPTNGKIISELVIEGADRTTLTAGGTTQLSAILRYSDGTTRDITNSGAVWNSSDAGNATVSQSGLVTAVDEGTVEISVTYNGLTQKDSIIIT